MEIASGLHHTTLLRCEHLRKLVYKFDDSLRLERNIIQDGHAAAAYKISVGSEQALTPVS